MVYSFALYVEEDKYLNTYNYADNTNVVVCENLGLPPPPLWKID